jgi:hypothetical protein
MDDMYHHPLKEYAVDAISRQLKTGVSDAALADLVVSLRDDNRLCNVTDEPGMKTTQIICSLGLIEGRT